MLPEEIQEIFELNYARGKVYVAPPLSPEIYVFDLAEQKIVQKFGRSGRGPGEFERPFIKLKTIELMADPSNITFEKAPELPESAGSQMATADIGLDRTVPSHHIIYRLCMSDDYTVIFGTFDRVEGKPNFAVINHESWDVLSPTSLRMPRHGS